MLHFKPSTILVVFVMAYAPALMLQAQSTETAIQCSLGKKCRVTNNIVFTPSMASPKSLELLQVAAGSRALVVDLLFESEGIDPAMPFNVLLRFSGDPATTGTFLLVGTEPIAPKTLATYSPDNPGAKVNVFPAKGPHPLPRMSTNSDSVSWFVTRKGVLAIEFPPTPQQTSGQESLFVTVWDKVFRIPFRE
jgi:hypothetical protein